MTPGLSEPGQGQAVSAPDYFTHALDALQQGYMTMPLALDAQGYPKRPIVPGWTNLVRSLEVLKDLPWGSAVGLGLILGPVSGNLAVIDIDDPDLAKLVLEHATDTQTVRTGRGNCHVYVVERQPSSHSRRFNIKWHGRAIGIELKAQGTQVAAPPTPGYLVICAEPPKKVQDIATAWKDLAQRLGVEPGQPEGYPPPWRPYVPEGWRNDSAYIEAHHLREAGMPLEMAQRYVRIRAEQDYAQEGLDLDEIARTVESAYSKPVIIGVPL